MKTALYLIGAFASALCFLLNRRRKILKRVHEADSAITVTQAERDAFDNAICIHYGDRSVFTVGDVTVVAARKRRESSA